MMMAPSQVGSWSAQSVVEDVVDAARGHIVLETADVAATTGVRFGTMQ
jgi:hypothetical protein